MSNSGALVPLAESSTLDRTVRHVVEEYDEVHFVVHIEEGEGEKTEELHRDAEYLLEKASVWADESGGDAETRYEVLETERYLFSPSDYAGLFAEYCEEHGLSTVVLDPQYHISATAHSLQPMQDDLERRDVKVSEAPVSRPSSPQSLPTSGGEGARFAFVFILSYVFYLLVGSLSAFDLITGAATALVVAVVTYRISFETSPSVRRFPWVLARFTVYAPYLLWEMVKANVQIAYVVLHPDLPIDPSMEEFEAAVWGGFPITTLANSITLTPGTLSVDADGRTLHVHALTEGARESLLDGDLEAAVRFVFYGRNKMSNPSPRERKKFQTEDNE